MTDATEIDALLQLFRALVEGAPTGSCECLYCAGAVLLYQLLLSLRARLLAPTPTPTPERQEKP